MLDHVMTTIAFARDLSELQKKCELAEQRTLINSFLTSTGVAPAKPSVLAMATSGFERVGWEPPPKPVPNVLRLPCPLTRSVDDSRGPAYT